MRKRVLPLAIVCSLACGAGCTNGLGSAFGDPVPDDETSLSALVVSSGTLSPAFDPAVTSYSVRLSEASSVTVIPVTQNPDASITVNGKAVASANPAEALPVADDPVVSSITVNATRAESKTYIVNFYVDDFVVQDAYLKADEVIENNQCGWSVSVSGDVIAVGTYTDKVYVFEKDADGNWSQTAILVGSNTEAGDDFGYSVSVNNSIIVVGASQEDSNYAGVNNIDGQASSNNSSSASGAAYVFMKNASGSWIQDAYLKASNSRWGSWFGASVDISGERIVVGAPQEDSKLAEIINANGSASSDYTAGSSGAAYVFAKDSNGNWVQDAYLKASNCVSGPRFGGDVSIDNDTIVVGAHFERSKLNSIINDNGCASSDISLSCAGAVYVFKKDAVGDWFQDAYLKPSNPDIDDFFGASVAISGKNIVVGVAREDSCQSGITNIDGESSLDNSFSKSGAAYVFCENGNGDWVQDAYLKPLNPDSDDRFGISVAVSGNRIIVGSYGESSSQYGVTNVNALDSEDNSFSLSGAACLFKKDTSGNWVQDAYLKASNSGLFDRFGYSVDINGETIVVGAICEASNQTDVTNADGEASDDNSCSQAGAAYVFKIIP